MIKQLYRFLSPRYQNLFLEYKVDLSPRYGHGQPPHSGLYDLINQRRASYKALLHTLLEQKAAIQAIKKCGEEKDPAQPCWNNGFLPGLDIATLYFMLNHTQAKTYIEVGSGNSTKVAARSIKDHGLSTRILSIDPQPRVEIDALADEVIRAPFEKTDLAILDQLAASDILFIDNSHRVLPNSDATVFFLEVLPRLKPGVIVHIHDIYLPYDYPPFMCDRFYSEQYLLAAFILANPAKYLPILPNYFISEDPELSQLLQPLWQHPHLDGVERHGGSFWMTIGA
ncbi:MAG: class I SAM-dependent methyltransferase [Saprospiraceae bacterium]